MSGNKRSPVTFDATGPQPAAKRLKQSKRLTDAPLLASALSGVCESANVMTFPGINVTDPGTLRQSELPWFAAEAVRLNAPALDLICVGRPCVPFQRQHQFDVQQPMLHFKQKPCGGGGDTCVDGEELPTGRSVVKAQVLKFEGQGPVGFSDVSLHII